MQRAALTLGVEARLAFAASTSPSSINRSSVSDKEVAPSSLTLPFSFVGWPSMPSSRGGALMPPLSILQSLALALAPLPAASAEIVRALELATCWRRRRFFYVDVTDHGHCLMRRNDRFALKPLLINRMRLAMRQLSQAMRRHDATVRKAHQLKWSACPARVED